MLNFLISPFPSLIISLLEGIENLQVTFPRLPYLLASGWVLTMGKNNRILESGREGEDFFLKLLVVSLVQQKDAFIFPVAVVMANCW